MDLHRILERGGIRSRFLPARRSFHRLSSDWCIIFSIFHEAFHYFSRCFWLNRWKFILLQFDWTANLWLKKFTRYVFLMDKP